MRIGLDARTLLGRRARGTGRNLRDAYRLIPGMRPNDDFFLYHRRDNEDGARPVHKYPLPARRDWGSDSNGGDLGPDTRRADGWPTNVKLCEIDAPGDRFDAWFQLRLPMAAVWDRLDLLHLPANAAAAWRPVSVVVTVHDLIPLRTPDGRSAAFERGVRWAVRGAAHIITPSAATRDDLVRMFHARRERITVIPWAADTLFTEPIAPERRAAEAARIRAQYDLDRPWLLNFSGRSPRKNAVGLLRAFAALPESVRDGLLLVLTGCEPEATRDQLLTVAMEAGIDARCRILGFLPEDDIGPLLRGAQGLAMPSLAEGFGLPILDAMACGVPVLTSNCTAMPEVAGDAAVYCDPRSVASIAEGLGRLLDEGTRRELVERGAGRVAEFTWERTAAVMCGVYERCLADVRRTGGGRSQKSEVRSQKADSAIRASRPRWETFASAEKLLASREEYCGLESSASARGLARNGGVRTNTHSRRAGIGVRIGATSASEAVDWLKLDCRNFRGDRPCAVGVQGDCPRTCAEYKPMGVRVLVIKLGALGDVIRTAALLPGIKESWPQSHVTWVTRPSGVRMLGGHPLIDRLLPLDAETLCHLEFEQFDLCLSLDKEPAPAGLAMRVRTLERRGIGLSAHGTPFPLNRECDHYFRLGLDDELKFRGNQLTYPELIYQAVGLTYRGQAYTLHPDAGARRRAEQVWMERGVGADECVIGLNTGAGRVFANKSWPPEKFGQLARRLMARDGRRVVLLGGADERAVNRDLAAACPGVIDTGCEHDEVTFAAIVARCGVMVSGDTMALHAAIAQRVPVVALFGPTCAQEIDVFGRGEKIVTGLDCSPCYRRTCDKSPHCMDDIDLERVEAAIERWAPRRRAANFVPLPVLEAVG